MEANNMAAMREVLEYLLKERDILDFCHNNLGSKTWEDWDKVYKVLRETIEKAMCALAARPRNCDIYTDIDSAFRACQEDRGYLKSPIDERRSVISFMLSTNTSGEANKDEGEPDESK